MAGGGRGARYASRASGYDERRHWSGQEVDNYVDGASAGVSAYYGVGGAYTFNSTGSSAEFGLGTPGVVFQPVEYMHRLFTGLPGWSK